MAHLGLGTQQSLILCTLTSVDLCVSHIYCRKKLPSPCLLKFLLFLKKKYFFIYLVRFKIIFSFLWVFFSNYLLNTNVLDFSLFPGETAVNKKRCFVLISQGAHFREVINTFYL